MKSKHSVSSFSYDVDDSPTIESLNKIAQREKRSFSFLVVEAIRKYVEAHEGGNTQFTLDKSSKSHFAAIPTMGEMLTVERLDKEDELDLEEWHRHAKARLQEIEAAIKRRREKIQGKQHISRPIPQLG